MGAEYVYNGFPTIELKTQDMSKNNMRNSVIFI